MSNQKSDYLDFRVDRISNVTNSMQQDDDDDESSCDSCDLKIDIPENDDLEVKGQGLKRKHSPTQGPDEEMLAVISGMEEEIERQLDAKAAKSHLTATNVKNILRTIITDEHVLAMVRQSLLGKCDSTVLPYEPKITRAKAKEMFGEQLISCEPQGTPAKKPATSKCHVLIAQELPEDSSDEEYQPNDELEQTDDDDKEAEDLSESGDVSTKDNSENVENESEKGTESESGSATEGDSESGSECGSGSEECEEEDDISDGQSETLEADIEEEIETESDESSSESEEETASESETDEDAVATEAKSEKISREQADDTVGESLNNTRHTSETECQEVVKDNEPDKISGSTKRASPHVTFALDHNEVHIINEYAQTSDNEDSASIGNESIVHRTRSKLSLSDTPLEAIERAFIPPDITTDMYDSECDDEDWKNFLTGFTEPLLPDMNSTLDDDEDADPEYNILADMDDEIDEVKQDEKEDSRIDHAVKVSKKEVNALVRELFKMAGMASSDEEDDKTSESDSQGKKSDKSDETSQGAFLTYEQRLLLDQQMRKLVQITTQNFLQTFCHPKHSVFAAECKSYLTNLLYLSGGNPQSAFYAGNLKEAIDIVNEWENHHSSEEKRRSLTRFIQTQLNKRLWWKNAKRRVRECVCEFPPKMMEIVANSKVFMYPLLLPPQPFRCDVLVKPCFVPAEEQLLVIGLEEFMDYAKKNPQFFPKKLIYSNVLPYVSKLLIPGKKARQLYVYIYKRTNVDPFKYYFEHHRAPGTVHYVLPYISSMIKAPKEQPKELLPGVWKKYVFRGK